MKAFIDNYLSIILDNSFLLSFKEKGRQIILSKYKNHTIMCSNNKKMTQIDLILLLRILLNKIQVGNWFKKPREYNFVNIN